MLWRGLKWWQQGFNRTTDSNNIEVIVLDDQKSRELRRIRTTRLAVYLYDIVNIHANVNMAKWGTNSWEMEETTSHKAGKFCSLQYRLRKRMEKKKLLQHVVFVVGHSSRCERRRTGLNFVERTRCDVVLVIFWLTTETCIVCKQWPFWCYWLEALIRRLRLS